jgi:phosphatidate cytidylyltransferase
LRRCRARRRQGERLKPSVARPGRGLAQRVLSAAVGIPVVGAAVGLGPAWLFAVFIGALAAAAQLELYRMFERVGVTANRGAGVALGGAVVLAFALTTPSRPWLLPLVMSVSVAAALCLGLRQEGGVLDWTRPALTLFGVCYCPWLLGHAVWLRQSSGGVGLTLSLLAVTWAGETAAYIVGRRWGRRPLAPAISPAKTVEGAVAQALVSVAVALAAGAAMGIGWIHATAIGVLLGVVGQVGDLAESFLKRSAQTKDAGGLLPGHGGLLDRLDSLLFNVPALYYYSKLFLTGH